ncbi:hypothetical protein PpBr36_07883 [Pyricularia pennisetigena]|uniref:hypothetical protein n=1 Tax=Pyricularia pennisetigena TaxID=1578925 RepID=UPI00115013CF|nr:hypothetical protein PpBr36_07883 [Pyricularia pennisetigena]TLS25886.1 hypothetical protein PpBr36_07883 [Pyricularia pennisetigena]
MQLSVFITFFAVAAGLQEARGKGGNKTVALCQTGHGIHIDFSQMTQHQAPRADALISAQVDSMMKGTETAEWELRVYM